MKIIFCCQELNDRINEEGLWYSDDPSELFLDHDPHTHCPYCGSEIEVITMKREANNESRNPVRKSAESPEEEIDGAVEEDRA